MEKKVSSVMKFNWESGGQREVHRETTLHLNSWLSVFAAGLCGRLCVLIILNCPVLKRNHFEVKTCIT